MDYDPESPWGKIISSAAAKIAEGRAELDRAKQTMLAKAYSGGGDPNWELVSNDPTFGCPTASDAQAVFTKCDAVVLGFSPGPYQPAAGASLDGILALDRGA